MPDRSARARHQIASMSVAPANGATLGYVIGRNSSRDDVIAKYRAWIVRQPALMAALPELRGKICHKWETGGLTPPYDHVNELKPPELAWEFLRRNPDYRRDYRTAVEAAADETGISQAPLRWGLRCSQITHRSFGCRISILSPF